MSINTNVVDEDEAFMVFNLEQGGQHVTVRVSGYTTLLGALKALHYLGQQEQLEAIAQECNDALVGDE